MLRRLFAAVTVALHSRTLSLFGLKFNAPESSRPPDRKNEIAKGIDCLNSAVRVLDDGNVAVQHYELKPDNILMVGGSVPI